MVTDSASVYSSGLSPVFVTVNSNSAAGMLLSRSLEGMKGLNAVSSTRPGKRLSSKVMPASGKSPRNSVCSKWRPPASVPRLGPWP